ncbi:MAG: hypothetical protein KGJ98_11370 [Chloroflexota bacterium]|nr:hypothetical protein [Chloroflexota bacterium]MDE3102823.1 hypothetical protein [Chloroflexota bacterium]
MKSSDNIVSRTEGQSLVVVALAMILLIGGLAFAIDWGYGLTQRRAMSNSAEAGALGAGALLARSVLLTVDGYVYSQTQEETYCEAVRFASQDRAFPPSGAAYGVTVAGYSDGATDPDWTVNDQACPPATSTAVPGGTTTLRVAAQVRYRSLIAAVIGWPSMLASASVRAKVVGVPSTPGPHVWPMVRHYDPADLVGMPCTPPCDPTSVPPFTFWSTHGVEPNMVYGNFKGQIDLSKMSARAPSVDALITQWDTTGSPEASPATDRKPDQSGKCGGPWDTIGGEDPVNENKQCSIPNWFAYFFGGSLSLDADHSSPPAGVEPPSALPPRPAVCPAPEWIAAPSCDEPAKGDWVETASGNLGSNNSILIRAVIAASGNYTAFSDEPVPGGPHGAVFGKALTVPIYMWDCGETYKENLPAGSQWTLIPGTGGDCSQIPQTGSTPSPDRVHLFTIVPFTFYEGLVETSSIRGYWGGALGSPDLCPSGDCPRDPLTNTVILGPDE